MLEIDERARRGVCANCGPVVVSEKDGRFVCDIARRAQRGQGKYRRKKSGNDYVKGEHGLTMRQAREFRVGKSCAICGGPGEAVDHCHRTMVIRGVLCRKCNTALGMLDDDPERCRSAARYLEDTNTAPAPGV